MDGTLAELLFEAVNLAVLGAGLWWLLFRPVRQALADEAQARAARAAELEQQATEVAKASEDLAARQAAYEAEVAKAEEEVLAAARAEADAIVEKAREQAEEARAAWDRERDQREAEFAQRAAATTARLAAEAATDLLRRIDGPELELALAKATVALLEPPVAAPAWVEAASEPSDEVRRLLAEVLPEGFEVRVRPDLIAGLRIGTPSGVIDGSAMGMARAAAEVPRA